MKTVLYQRVGGLICLIFDTACGMKNRTVKVCSRNCENKVQMAQTGNLCYAIQAMLIWYFATFSTASFLTYRLSQLTM